MHTWCRVGSFVSGFLIAVSGSPGADPRTVILSADTLPGSSPGSASGTFKSAVINNAGNVAFTGKEIGSGNYGVYSEALSSPPTLARVAQETQPCPSLSGVGFTGLNAVRLVLADNGQCAFYAGLTSGPSGARYGYFATRTDGVLAYVAADGQGIAGLPPGSFDSAGPVTGFALSSNGKIAFQGNAIVPPSFGKSYSGVWEGDAGTNLDLAAKSDDPNVVNTGFIGFGYPVALNDANVPVLALGASIFGPTKSGIYRGATGGLTAVLTTKANLAPNYPGLFSAVMHNWAGINRANAVAFWLSLASDVNGTPATNPQSIWLADASGLRLIVRQGDSVPGLAGSVYTSLGDPVVSDSGHVAFGGGLLLDAASKNFLALRTPGTQGQIKLIAYTGAPAPGFPAGSTMTLGSGTPSMNRRGQVVFGATVSVPGQGDFPALYVTDLDAAPQLMLREGVSYTTRLGPRLLSGFLAGLAHPTGGNDGRPRALNDNGQLVVIANYSGPTNGSGVFVVQGPTLPCNLADVTDAGGTGGPDGRLTGSDVVAFFSAFFQGCLAAHAPPCNRADLTDAGGTGGPDGQLSASDVVAFFTALFAGCGS